MNPIDGLLVIGGYDDSRVQGNITTFNTFHDCATCVVVTSITYDTVHGSTPLFSNSSETLEIDLEPFQRGLQLPQDVFDNFARASNGTYNASLGLLTYPRANPPDGNLSVTLQNGYTTVIPSSELFSLARDYNSDCFYSIDDPEWVIAEPTNDTDPPYVAAWGIPYLTMNYLIVDYDRGTFQMAPAIRTDFGSAEAGALIKTVCPPVPTTSATPTPSKTAPPTTTTSAAPVVHTNHTGAIAGGVVGGVVGLALIAGLLFFIFFWRKRRAPTSITTAQEPVLEKGKSSRLSTTTDATRTDRTELPSPSPPPDQHAIMTHWLSSQTDEEEVRISLPLALF